MARQSFFNVVVKPFGCVFALIAAGGVGRAVVHYAIHGNDSVHAAQHAPAVKWSKAQIDLAREKIRAMQKEEACVFLHGYPSCDDEEGAMRLNAFRKKLACEDPENPFCDDVRGTPQERPMTPAEKQLLEDKAAVAEYNKTIEMFKNELKKPEPKRPNKPADPDPGLSRKPRQWTAEENQAIMDAANQPTTPDEDRAELRAFEEAAKHPMTTPEGKKAFQDAFIVLMLKLERKRRHESGI